MILAHIHCFYPKHLKECLGTLASYPQENLVTVVTYIKGDNEAKNHIEALAPNAVLLPVPNVGRDVAPFIAALNWAAKQGTAFDYVVKLHTKRDDYPYPSHTWATKGRWRRSLLAALKDWQKVKAALDKPGVGIAGLNAMIGLWSDPSDVVKTVECCAAVGITVDKVAPFIGGTMFAARWEAVSFWAGVRLRFEKEPIRHCGTVAHGMERAFSAAALAKGLKTVGVGQTDKMLY